MARGPKKLRPGKKRKWVTHNQNNDGGGDRKRMLDRRRERIFQLELMEALEKSKEKTNIKTFFANIHNKAAIHGISDAKSYLEKITGDGLEKPVADEIERLLYRYSKVR